MWVYEKNDVFQYEWLEVSGIVRTKNTEIESKLKKHKAKIF